MALAGASAITWYIRTGTGWLCGPETLFGLGRSGATPAAARAFDLRCPPSLSPDEPPEATTITSSATTASPSNNQTARGRIEPQPRKASARLVTSTGCSSAMKWPQPGTSSISKSSA